MKEITYRKEGDYLIPNLAIKGAESDYHIVFPFHLALKSYFSFWLFPIT